MTTQTIDRTTQATPTPLQPMRLSVKARAHGCQTAVKLSSSARQTEMMSATGSAGGTTDPAALLLGALAMAAVTGIRDSLAPRLGVKVYSAEATAACDTDVEGLPGLYGLALDIRIESTDGDEAVQRLIQAWRESNPVYTAFARAMDVSVSSKAINWYEAN